MIFLNWILFGLAAGVVAKILLPGDEKMGWVRTIVVGIAGAFVGGMLGAYLGLGATTSTSGLAGVTGLSGHSGISINNLSLASMAAQDLWSVPHFLTAVGGAFVLVLINRVVTRS